MTAMDSQSALDDICTVAPVGVRCELPDGPAILTLYPGAVGLGPAHIALFGAVRSIHGGRVFVAGPGATASAVWVARSGAQVTTWNDNLSEHMSLSTSLAQNGLPLPAGGVSWDFGPLEPGSCDLALVHLPRGRELQIQLVHLGAAMLGPGGRLAIVGARNEGVKGAVEEAGRLCGRAGVVSRKGGYHAAVAYAPSRSVDLPTVRFAAHSVEVDGRAAELQSCSGVFAADRLDEGAEALVEAMEIEPGARVLDLGCGTGLVGLAALRRGGNLIATDVSARAVMSTRRTLAANGYGSATVLLSIGASAVASDTIDTVVTNPPFHLGHDVDFEVSRLFVAEAARIVRTGGRLFLVANTFLDYRPWLERYFVSVGFAGEGPRFRVWTAQR